MKLITALKSFKEWAQGEFSYMNGVVRDVLDSKL
jgi:hypothetical protein